MVVAGGVQVMGCALPIHAAEIERRQWVAGQLARVRGLADTLGRMYGRRLERAGGEQAAANAWLRQVVERLQVLPALPADSDDDSIRERARVLAERAAPMVRRGHMGKAREALAEPLGLSVPDDDQGARLMCAIWWRRQLRSLCARQAEAVARDIGLVGRRWAPYVSEHGFRRWVSASRRNAAFLARCEAVNDDGQVYGLDELAALSVSNPEVRRAELMTRVRGAEEWAERAGGWVPAFVTVTCPSGFHARLSGGAVNPRYQGASPRDGAEYLAGMWARCRADLARRGLDWWGLRVAEPHHDGTPHWHLLIYARPGDLSAVLDVMRAHAMRQDGDEPGAARYRFQSLSLPPGAAAGYVAKYVSKNINGFGIESDFEAGLWAADAAARVRAWASIWGVRQFAWVGAPAVTVWRELRRAEAGEAGGLWAELVAAADAGDWCRYVELMGGAGPGLAKSRPAAPLRESGRVGRYGDQVKRVVGVVCRGVGSVVTRWRQWVVRFGARSRAQLGLVSITVRGAGDAGGNRGRAAGGGAVVRGAGGGGGCAPVHRGAGGGAAGAAVDRLRAESGGGGAFA